MSIIRNDIVWISAVRQGVEDNYKIFICNDDWNDETKQQIRFKYQGKAYPDGIWHSNRSQISTNNYTNTECMDEKDGTDANVLISRSGHPRNTNKRDENSIQIQNEKLVKENNNLKKEMLEMNGDIQILNQLDMEELCQLEEKLEISLRIVREEREKYYSYFCIQCESKQKYLLFNGCNCCTLCSQCILTKKMEYGTSCPQCLHTFS